MALLVSLDGSNVAGLLRLSIHTNNYYASDTFSLVFAMGDAPLLDIATWSLMSGAYVQIGVVDDSTGALTNLISGNVDSFTVDPVLRIVSMEGRDLSAILIDSYLQEDFVNQTASEVVTTIAGRYGLSALVTATQGIVGRYFEDGYTKLSLGQFSNLRSNWDLIVQLARQVSFDVFVQGNQLNFQPMTSLNDLAVNIGLSDITKMRIEKSLVVPSSPNIMVKSWNSQNATAYASGAANVGATAVTGASASGPPAFLFSKSNFTSAQIDQYAAQYTSEISRRHLVLHLEMPWNLTISPRSLLLLNATQSSFDGLYQIDSIDRVYSAISGSTQTVSAVSWEQPAQSTTS